MKNFLFPSEFPEIKLNDRFTLSFPEISNPNDMVDCYDDQEMRLFLTPNCHPKTTQEAIQETQYYQNIFYDKIGLIWFLLDTHKNHKFIGSYGFNSIDSFNRRADLSYEISSEYRQQGLSYNAIKKICEYGFEKIGLVRIEANCLLDNVKSQQLLEKLGFQREGILRKYKYIRNEFLDSYMYSLTI